MPIMRYALVLTYVLALALVERAAASEMQNAECKMQNEETSDPVVGTALCRPGAGMQNAECKMQNEGSGIKDQGSGDEETAEPTVGAVIGRPQDEADSPVCHSEQREESVPTASGAGRLGRLAAWVACCAAALLLILSFQIDNLAYTVSAQAHRSTESFATRLVERVESTPGYRNGMPVVIVGGFPANAYYNQMEIFSLVEDYSDRSTSVIPMNKHVYYYLNDWLNVPWPDPGEDILQAVSDSVLFQSMPLYPSDGSIVIDRGMVIVKLAKKYTPKKAYEIAYEARK